MKLFLKIALLAAVVLSVWIAAPGLTGNENLSIAKNVRFEKIKRSSVVRPLFCGRFHDRLCSVVSAPVSYIACSPIGDCYREQPLLFGVLSMIAAMVMAVLGFLVYIFRSSLYYN